MKKRDKNNEVATFRFGVIAEFVNGTRLNYGEKEKLLNEKVGRSYQIPYSNRTRLARTTIEGWILDYKMQDLGLKDCILRPALIKE